MAFFVLVFHVREIIDHWQKKSPEKMGKSPTKNSIPKNKKEFNEFRENDAFDEKLKKTRERLFVLWGGGLPVELLSCMVLLCNYCAKPKLISCESLVQTKKTDWSLHTRFKNQHYVLIPEWNRNCFFLRQPIRMFSYWNP